MEKPLNDLSQINFEVLGRYVLETIFNYNFTAEDEKTGLGRVFFQNDPATETPNLLAIVTRNPIESSIYEMAYSYISELGERYKVSEIILLSMVQGDPEVIKELQNIGFKETDIQPTLKIYDYEWLSEIFVQYPEIEETWFGEGKRNIIKRRLLSYYNRNVWWVNIPEAYWNNEQEYFRQQIAAGFELNQYLSIGDILLVNRKGTDMHIAGLFKCKYSNEKGSEWLVEEECYFEKPIPWSAIAVLPNFRQSSIYKANAAGNFLAFDQAGLKAILNLTEFAPFPTYTAIFEDDEKFQSTPLSSDDPNSTTDLLGFTSDVRAFATIMALKATKAPLAVALFGAWGSGKSFFMNKLRHTINELSENQGFLSEYKSSFEPSKPELEKPFCEGVVQIEFNAWSYLDANLWAGLVSTIFERLDEYFTENTKGDIAKMHIRQKLIDKLSILGKQKSNKLEQKQLREKVKKDLLEQQKELHSKRQEELLNLTKTALNKATDGDEFYNKLIELGYKDIVKYAENPEELRKSIRSLKSSFLSVRSYITRKNLMWLGLSVVLAVGGYMAYRFGFIEIVKNWATKIFALPVATIITQLIPILKKYFEVAKDLNTKVKDITEEFNKVKASSKEFGIIERKLQQNMKVMQENELQISKLNSEMDDVSNILSGDLTKEAFIDYISHVNSKGEYEKHLGIISIIRRDFETLSELFSDERIEQTSEDAVQITNEDREEVQSQLTKPLDRIILYIDDLDRCDDSKVLEVLQAVHLLMAFPLFIVVVGVDKRCVNNALIHRNTLQYSQLLCDRTLEQLEKEFKLNLIHPDEYLEKIFQIPFHLEEAAEWGMKELVKDLLKEQLAEPELKDIEKPESSIKQEEFDEAETADVEPKVYTGASKHIGIQEQEAEEEVAQKFDEMAPHEEEEDQAIFNDELNADLVVVKPSELRISEDELRFLQDATWLVGNSPRTMKRFINMYRIIRMHQQLKVDKDNPNADYMAIIFILGISVGQYKDIADDILCRCMLNHNFELKELLVKAKRNGIKKREQTIKDKLAGSEILKDILQIKGKQFSEYIPFISRFSFRANTSVFTNIKVN